MSTTHQQAADTAVTDLASGSWHVAAGNEAAFVARWQEFLRWTRDEATGFVDAVLIRDRGNSSHFISVAQWTTPEDTRAWRQLPSFATHFRACRELCEDLYAADYTLEVRV